MSDAFRQPADPSDGPGSTSAPDADAPRESNSQSPIAPSDLDRSRETRRPDYRRGSALSVLWFVPREASDPQPHPDVCG
jgi:hypothetical protein